jgi:hypothetical protein
MAFEVSYNLENEQQFWDGEQRIEPPTTLFWVAATEANQTRRARRHRFNALSRGRGHRQFLALLPQRHHKL